MPSTERPRDVADLRARAILVELGRELRSARLAAGLSQVAVARAAGISQAHASDIERARHPGVSIPMLARMLAAVGLELAVRAYPGGSPVRGEAHVRLLGRLRALASPAFVWRAEVPLPGAGGRAWDALLRLGPLRIAIEAETRPRDVQALLRRLSLKRRDDEVDRPILLLADTRWNRLLMTMHGAELARGFPMSSRTALAALRRGDAPGADAVVLL